MEEREGSMVVCKEGTKGRPLFPLPLGAEAIEKEGEARVQRPAARTHRAHTQRHTEGSGATARRPPAPDRDRAHLVLASDALSELLALTQGRR